MKWHIILLGLLLPSCQIGSKYHPPETCVTPNWKSQQTLTVAPQVEHWWDIFQDPQLSELIHQALDYNPSLDVALQKVEQARAFAKVTGARLLPQLNFDPAASNAPIRVHTFGSTANPPPVLIRNHISNYTLPFTLLYEFDFWGKWRNQYKAARFQAQAEAESYQTALLFLTTDLANAYFQLRIQDAQIEILRDILGTRQTAVDIHQCRYTSSLIDYSDVSWYQTDYATIEAEYYEAVRKRSVFENQLAVLIGISPTEFKIDAMPLKDIPPQIPSTTPATVLLRRPDLAEQERRMAAMHADVHVAYASFFPAVDLTGGLSLLTNDFIKTLKDTWVIGSNLVQILFDGGGRTANVSLFIAKFNEALASYREKTLIAFQEVEDSLTSLDWIKNEMHAIDKAIYATNIAHQIALDRYKFGLSNYLSAVNYQRTSLDKQLVYLQLLSQRYLHTLHLIKAIGGGWE